MNPEDTPERAFDDDFDRLERYREALTEIVKYSCERHGFIDCPTDVYNLQRIAAEALDP